MQTIFAKPEVESWHCIQNLILRTCQDSLGGNAKTTLLVCCSPSMQDAQETLSSLRFGSRAKGVINTVQARP